MLTCGCRRQFQTRGAAHKELWPSQLREWRGVVAATTAAAMDAFAAHAASAAAATVAWSGRVARTLPFRSATRDVSVHALRQ